MAKEGAGGGPDWNGLLKWSLAHGGDGTTPSRALRTAVVIPLVGPQSELEQIQDEMQESLTQEEQMAINSKVQEEQSIRASSRIAGMSTTTNRTEDGTRFHNQAGSIPGAHSDVEAAQLQQGAAALVNLALGAGNRGGAGNTMVINQQLRLEQGDAAMDNDAQDNADADADEMQS